MEKINNFDYYYKIAILLLLALGLFFLIIGFYNYDKQAVECSKDVIACIEKRGEEKGLYCSCSCLSFNLTHGLDIRIPNFTFQKAK